MSVTDPIADMLTKIRNASRVRKDKVDVRSSKMNQAILDVLKREKFIQNFKLMDDEKQGTIRVYLKYDQEGKAAIEGLKRISTPGVRIYTQKENIPKVLGGLGLVIVSTSRGLMTDTEAREKGLGGEVLCYVW